ncbi:MAG TPA: AAA family ATPase [Thermoanaerobaculia bacterium]|jgi:predicted ATPase
MEGKRLLRSITLKNLLSYGSEGMTLDLEPLNVLIGPNAVGKSNLIEAISLLAATPRDLLRPFREGGGSAEWIWKGAARNSVASLEAILLLHEAGSLRYHLDFTIVRSRFELVDEFVYNEALPGFTSLHPLYKYNKGSSKIMTRNVVHDTGQSLHATLAGSFLADMTSVSPEQSILSQVRGADVYPELTRLASDFGRIAFFREWNLGRFAPSRLPQKTDLPEDFLLEDASNLGLVVNDLQHRPTTRRLLLEKFKIFYEVLEDISTKIQSGTVQIFFHERNLSNPVPATRLSDGTLHYLCLLVILCHPDPPPLICIEEPEIGLHPDVIPHVADLLLEASKRTQLIVTTHSETLVSRLSEVPESVVVCERDDRGTQLRRLEPERLRVWLDKYMLGELWRMGEIGGNRW